MAHKRTIRALMLTSALLPVAGAAYASETIAYAYDALGRLITVQHSGTVNNGLAASYCFDPASNRTRYRSDSGGALASCSGSSPSPTPTPAPTPTPSPTPTPTPTPTPDPDPGGGCHYVGQVLVCD